MGSNRVVTTIQVDNAAALSAFDKLGGALTKSTALGVVMGNAITGGLNLAKDAVGGLIGKFGEASKLSLGNIGTAGDMAKLTGMSFAESQKDIAAFTERMSVAAASLPGDTASFVALGIGISDNLVPAFQDLNGVLDKNSFNQYRDDLAKFGAMRTEFSGVTEQDTAKAISQLLGGSTGLAELKDLNFFAANPAVMAFIEKGISDSGKDIKSMTKKELAELTRSALKVSDEVIKAAQNSTAGLAAGFKSSLFDPNTGIFGIMRDLNKKVDGNQSVFSSFERIVQKLLGEKGVFANGAKILQGLGLSSDPMQLLADGLGAVGVWLDSTNKTLLTIRRRFASGNLKALNDDTGSFANLGSKLGKGVASFFNKGIKLIQSSSVEDWKNIGNKFGDMIAGAINVGTNFLRNADFTQIARLLIKGLLGALVFANFAITSAFTGIDWGSLAISLLKAGTVAVLGVGAMIAGAMTSFGLMGVAAFAALGVAFVAGIGALRDMWFSSAQELRDGLSSLFSGIGNFLANAVSMIPGVDIDTTGKGVKNKATGLDQMGLFGAIARERSAAPGTDMVIANSSEAILNRQQQRGLLTALNSRRSGGLSVGNLTIHAGAVTDPKQLAKQVMRELGNEWSKYQQGQMSPSY